MDKNAVRNENMCNYVQFIRELSGYKETQDNRIILYIVF